MVQGEVPAHGTVSDKCPGLLVLQSDGNTKNFCLIVGVDPKVLGWELFVVVVVVVVFQGCPLLH